MLRTLRFDGENDEDASVEEGSKESIHLSLREMTPDLGNISTAEKNWMDQITHRRYIGSWIAHLKEEKFDGEWRGWKILELWKPSFDHCLYNINTLQLQYRFYFEWTWLWFVYVCYKLCFL